MRHPMQLRSVDAIPVVTEPTAPDVAIGVQWTHHDAPLEPHDLVGMLDGINTQR